MIIYTFLNKVIILTFYLTIHAFFQAILMQFISHNCVFLQAILSLYLIAK